MAVLVIAVVFLAGQVVLLVLAIGTVGKPSHDRYLDLMLTWPFVLVAPYVIAKRRALPGKYFSDGGQHDRSRAPMTGSAENVAAPPSLTPEQYRDALRLAMGKVPDPDPGSSPLTAEQYRAALRMTIDRLSSVSMDRDLQELLWQLKSLERQQDRPQPQTSRRPAGQSRWAQ